MVEEQDIYNPNDGHIPIGKALTLDKVHSKMTHLYFCKRVVLLEAGKILSKFRTRIDDTIFIIRSVNDIFSGNYQRLGISENDGRVGERINHGLNVEVITMNGMLR